METTSKQREEEIQKLIATCGRLGLFSALEPDSMRKHFANVTHEELQRMLQAFLDIDILRLLIGTEQDRELLLLYKYIHHELISAVESSREEVQLPLVISSGPFGYPPHERPSIYECVLNFVAQRFGDGCNADFSKAMDIASKAFLRFLDCYRLESPAGRKSRMSRADSYDPDDDKAYHVTHARWFGHVFVPTFCHSFVGTCITRCFGRKFLILVWDALKEAVMECFQEKKCVMTDKQKRIACYHLPRFVELFEKELFDLNSEIWKVETESVGTVSTSSGIVSDQESDQESTGSGDSLDDSEEDVDVEVIKASASVSGDCSGTRDHAARCEEANGVIEFHMLGRSSEPVQLDRRALLWLVDLKNVFAGQLPSMPMVYITELVFDASHKTLALIKNNKPIGGICFRLFPQQVFTEIVFCAVSATEQVKGYGTLLMNMLKDYLVSQGIRHLLVFADQDAVGYFRKQGFSDEISLPREVYNGFLMEYEKANLMGCELAPLELGVSYVELCSRVRQQKAVISSMAARMEGKQLEAVSDTLPGLTIFKSGIRSIALESIPGYQQYTLNEVSNKKSGSVTLVGNQVREAQQVMKKILNVLKRHRAAWPFLKPVDVKYAPTYYQFIKYPMDLQTITDRFAKGYYVSPRFFKADVQRMLTNCWFFNDTDTEYYAAATALNKVFKKEMKKCGLFSNP